MEIFEVINMAKESNNSILSRIDERTKIMKEQNDKEHKLIMDRIDDLCNHVNEENMKTDKRLCTLEDESKLRFGEKQGVRKVYKVLTGILSVSLAVIGILAGIGVI
jgi:hypothetical protein